MGLDLVKILIGFVVLVGGGESLVRGAVGLSLRLRVTPAVIGLTVVSAGTSMPELMVSVVAAFHGNPDVAVGNVIGSNIFNLALVLGVCATVVTLPVLSKTLRLEWPFLVVASGGGLAFMNHGISRPEGAVLLVSLIGFLWWMVRLARRDVERAEEAKGVLALEGKPPPGLLVQLFLVTVGLLLLFVGGRLIVDGATHFALRVGISERVVGLTVVAMGTSLPELASSLIAALRGRTDVAVGNVVGSSIFNLLGIFGVASLLHPLAVDERFLRADTWWMLAFTVLFGALAVHRRRIGRREGVLLLIGFLVYMGTLF